MNAENRDSVGSSRVTKPDVGRSGQSASHSRSGLPLPIINPARCRGSNACVEACPTQALASRDGKAYLAAREACNYCSVCYEICPHEAIELPFLVTFGKDSHS